MKKRFFASMLVLCIVLGMFPPEAFADESTSFAEPKVTSLTVSYDGGETVELLGNQPTISMPAGSKPVFTVTFDSIELLNKVFVTSTKDGETKYLEASLQDGQYVTNGYFDPSDTDYVPGTITVTYSKKAVKVDASGNIGGMDLDTLRTQLTAQGISSRNETISDDGTVSAQVVLGNMFGAMAGVYFDAAVSELMAGSGIDQGELDRWLGVYQDIDKLSSYDLEDANGNPFTLYLGDGEDFGDSDTYLMLVRDVTSNKYTKMLLSKAAGMASLGDISNALESAHIITKTLLDYHAITDDTAALREEIETHPTMTQQERAEANAKITALDRDKKAFLIGMTVIPLMLLPVGKPLVISALLAGYASIADYFWDYRIGMIRGSDPIENIFVEKDGHSDRIEFTGGSIDESGSYFISNESRPSVHVNIKENVNVDLCIHGCSSVWINMEKGSTLHIKDCKYKESADGTIAGGIVKRISMKERSKLTFEKCIINEPLGQSTAISCNNGEIIINSGLIEGEGLPLINLEGTNGKMEINGGTIKARCYINGGTLVVNGGVISDEGSGRITLKNNGKLTVNSGIINVSGIVLQESIENGEETNTAVIKGGEITGQISINDGSEVIIDGGSIQSFIRLRPGCRLTINDGIINTNPGIRNGGVLTMKGGTVYGGIDNFVEGEGETSDKAQLIVDGGTINGGIQDLENGQITINGGKIYGGGSREGIYSHGQITITGGQVFNGIETYAQLTISNGQIFGGTTYGVDNPVSDTTLIIKKDSDITITGKTKAIKNTSETAGVTVSVVADKTYTGGTVYFDTTTAQGTPLTIEEANTVDFTQSYLRLVADGVSTGPSGGDQEDCVHDYTSTVTAPTCTERGYTTHTCTKCGHSYQDNYVNALGHRFGEWVVVREATSTTNGSRERTCTVCNYKETGTIPATGSSGGGSGSSGGSSGSGSSSSSDSSSSRPDRESSASSGYQVSLPKDVTGGRVNLSRTDAVTGQAVTVVVHPDDGYELDTLKVLDSSGKELSLRKQNGR